MEEKISPCEEQIMLTVWEEAGEPDMREVMELANRRYNREWKPQTISTFLSRLVKKGFLTSSRKGRRMYYHPVKTLEDYRRGKIADIVTELYAGDRAAAARDLSEHEKEAELQ